MEFLHNLFQQPFSLLPDQRIVVGFSGGPDSVCLVHTLHRLGYPIIIAHLDHRIRPESVQDAAWVRQWASRLGLPCQVLAQDVPAYASQHGLSIEHAARELRYKFLFDIAIQFDAQAVAVAHHADDQVETILLHLLRGSGLEGLAGMPFRQLPNPWSDHIPLVRPLLATRREQILAYCQQAGLETLHDASNTDPAYLRNRVRLELIPLLQTFNPNVKQSLLQLSEIARADLLVLSEQVETAWLACRVEVFPGSLSLERARLAALPLAIQRLLLRRAASRLRGDLMDVAFDTIERIRAFITQPLPRTRQDVGGGLRLELDGDKVWLVQLNASLPLTDFPQLPEDSGSDSLVSIPGVVHLMDGWELLAEKALPMEALQRSAENMDGYQVWLDAACLDSQPLTLRPRRPGDIIHPLGLNGHSQKISDAMINAHIPSRARRRWPVLSAGERVIWLPGIALSHFARLTETSTRAVHLKLHRSN